MAGSNPLPKPWEASGIAKPGEVVSSKERNVTSNVNNTISRPVPPRPWQQQGYGNSYGGYRGGYGGLYGGSEMYGGSMYNSGMGGPYGGMGMGPYNQGPNSFGPPAPPPGFWVSFLRVMHGVVNFCGRVAFLISQNTQAFHMFITALLQLCDRSGMLYGELARFILRLLGIKTKPKKGGVQGAEAPSFEGPGLQFVEAPKANNSWDNIWTEDGRGK